MRLPHQQRTPNRFESRPEAAAVWRNFDGVILYKRKLPKNVRRLPHHTAADPAQGTQLERASSAFSEITAFLKA
jgi:hypothetical protein